MADPRSIVPYHDPYDTPLDLDCFNFVADPNLALVTLPSPNLIQVEPNVQQPQQLQQQQPQHFSSGHTDNIVDPNRPFDDPMMCDMPNNNNNNNGKFVDEAGPSGNIGRATTSTWSDRGRSSDSGQDDHLPYDNGIPVLVWPPPNVPFLCTCCHVLREIIHTNGNYSTRLEIHGRFGMICHAVQESRDLVLPASTPLYHMYDFSKRSIENVKQFLKQYCEDRKLAGFEIVPDPLSIFYEALCVGLEWLDENLNKDDFGDFGDFSDLSPANSVEILTEDPQVGDQGVGQIDIQSRPRRNIKQQRERAGKMKLKDLREYFHLPIEDAAKRMHLCPTVVKKICRRDGMARWPHRKIKSIQRQISILLPSLDSNDERERARAQEEIQRLQQEMTDVCAAANR